MSGPQYGSQHQKDRKIALAMLVDGTPCWRCGRPMFKARQRLDLDHVIPVARGGKDGPKRLAHASCNRSAGAVIGNRSIKRRLPKRRGAVPKDGTKSSGSVFARRKLPDW